MELITLTKGEGATYQHVLWPNRQYRYCKNAEYNVCNWVMDDNEPHAFCQACRLNRTIPNLSNPDHLVRWSRIELEKHRLVYTLLRMGVPVFEKALNQKDGLAFDFLAEEDSAEKIVMGHAEGLITITLSEADELKRLKTKEQLGEPYRTVIGHFRHETGHYYWDRLIFPDSERLEAFREIFGDERADYGEALQLYYKNGPGIDWQQNFVSAYATAHPWEDWAETWAHYLHIMDSLETAHAFGLRVNPEIFERRENSSVDYKKNPFDEENFDQLMKLWVPLTGVLNTFNRSMGQPDFYPFLVSEAAIKKLSFVNGLIHDVRSGVMQS
jgi:hypothetical protein